MNQTSSVKKRFLVFYHNSFHQITKKFQTIEPWEEKENEKTIYIRISYRGTSGQIM